MEVILKNVRLSYPDIWQPGAPPKNAKPGQVGKFGCQGIFAPDSEAAKVAQAAFLKAAQETFGPNWQAILEAMEKSKKCIRNGNANLDQSGNVRQGYAGNLYIVARNKSKPVIVDAAKRGGEWVHLTEADGKPYGGCYVNLKVDIYAQKAKGEISANVSATLKAIQFVSDGEAFGSGPGNADGFEDMGTDEGEGSASPAVAANLFG
jgi:Protein of unknown function (DUF2815)